MTYLELVNSVLRRIRENPVSSVTDTSYSTMLGDIINDVKAEVEDSWEWLVLRESYLLTTQASTFSYLLEQTQQRIKIVDVWNDSDKIEMFRLSHKTAEQYFQNPQFNSPRNYAVNSYDQDFNLQIDVWPIPDGAYSLSVNAIVPQPDLVNDGDKLLVPFRPVIEGTLARVISERGEDGGMPSELVQQRYRNALADAIALDVGLRDEDTYWYPA